MRSIAVINQKGGVGKTTTTVNLSVALARMGRRVRVIDLDPQAHASLHLGTDIDGNGASIYEVLLGNSGLDDVSCAIEPGLTLVPSHIDLAAAEIELAGEVGRELLLRDALQRCESEYDFTLIDCPPSLGILTLNALAGAEEVFLPLQPHFLALHGLSKLLGTIELVSQRLNRQLKLTGVLFCMYETATRLAAEVQGDVKQFFHDCLEPNAPWAEVTIFSTCIRRNIRLAEAPSYGQSIFSYAPNCHGATDYFGLAEEVLQQRAASEIDRRLDEVPSGS